MAADDSNTAFASQWPDGWRLLVESEIDIIVRELRKNALWGDSAERNGLGALWVGGGRWPGAHNAGKSQAEIRREFGERRVLGKAGECIGLALFSDSNDEALEDDYAVGRLGMLESFLALREVITGATGVRELDIQAVLYPYLLVIRDAETTGPITRCALVSIQRFINHGIVDLGRPEAVPALLEVTRAVTHCRFEATDAASDEAVLMQILSVLGALVLSPGGGRLNDVTVCGIMETVLSMSCQMRLSEMLRKSAEATLFTLVTFVFGKLAEIEAEAESEVEEESDYDKEQEQETMAAMVMPSPSTMLVNTERSVRASSERMGFGLPAIRELYRVLVAMTNPQDLQYTDSMRMLALNTLQAAFQRAGDAMAGSAALRELTLGGLNHSLLLILQRDQPGLIAAAMRVLFLIFSSHRRFTKGQLELFFCQTLGRLMAPPASERQASRAAQRFGPGSGPSTPGSANDSGAFDAVVDGTRVLEIERALTHAEEAALYHGANLRRGVRGRVAVGETRRLLLEGLHHLLTGDEALLTDLWVNFDCDLQRGNMFDYVMSLVTQRAVAWGDGVSGEDEAFLDVLLFHIVRVGVRAGVAPPGGRWGRLLGNDKLETKGSGPNSLGFGSSDATHNSPMTLSQLLDRKRHKDAMMRAAAIFNERPKDGVAHLQTTGALEQGANHADQLAQFLRTTPTLNKRLVGEFLAKPSNFEVLQAYVAQFDFAGRRLDEALRALLGAFRLPGESQQIERIMEAFATAYVASGSPDIATKDAAFILSYAVVMLNTDQHSPQVRGRMRLPDFARNLRGVNDGSDFGEVFLSDLFAAVRDSEIVFPEEHEGAAGFEYAWRIVTDSDAGGWASTRGSTAAYDHALLEATWPRILRALVRVLANFSSDYALRRALLGLHALVGAAAAHGLTACIDETLVALSGLTRLPGATAQPQQVLVSRRGRHALLPPDTAALMVAQSSAQELEAESVVVSQVALDFGGDYHAQMALVALAELSTMFCSAVGSRGWDALMATVRTASCVDLLPATVLPNAWVPRTATLRAMADAAKKDSAAHKQEAGGGGSGGLLSAFSSLWGNTSGPESPRSPSRRPEQLMWRVAPDALAAVVGRAKKAVHASTIAEFAELPRGMADDALARFLPALAQHLPQPPAEGPAEYSPAALFFLEIILALFIGSPERVPALWPLLEAPVQRMLECADDIHVYELQHTVRGLFAVATRVLENADRTMLDAVERIVRCLGLLRDAADTTFEAIAADLATGVHRLCAADTCALVSVPSMWDILRQLLKRMAHAPVSIASALAVLPPVVELLKSGAIDRAAYFMDTLDVLSAFMPSDRALVTPEGKIQVATLIAALSDMQAAANAEAAEPPSADDAYASLGIRSHRRTLTEPSIASTSSRVGISVRSTPLAMWTAAMNALAAYACCSSRNARQLACAQIQRAVTTNLRSVPWVTAAFHRVLFPLMDALLRADMLADSSMEDTHARCISMLTSFFLHNAAALHSEKDSEDVGAIWLRLIGVLAAYVYTSNLARVSLPGAGSEDVARGHLGVLGEMAEESARNCVLVLDSMGIFGDAEDRDENELWKKSWEVLDKASPQLRLRIFPASVEEASAPDHPESAAVVSTETEAQPDKNISESMPVDAVTEPNGTIADSADVVIDAVDVADAAAGTVGDVDPKSDVVVEGQSELPVLTADKLDNACLLSSPSETTGTCDVDHHSESKKKRKNRVNIITVA
ncbi:hypothetical protein BX661DRAFT_168235 [Kickxella alabastrina]|uniref:uncharacterized protein n=1 Tax=Kickxella alabastrina TaxID=61397 RepID=UPI00221EFFEF|nr:uncharacterized protein BX661DRAFT_168235 [Kickxella alabastrina]KAI7835063.1 hypothetical protein BX661DRAFT_168235 [Kickxella alabastrina]